MKSRLLGIMMCLCLIISVGVGCRPTAMPEVDIVEPPAAAEPKEEGGQDSAPGDSGILWQAELKTDVWSSYITDDGRIFLLGRTDDVPFEFFRRYEICVMTGEIKAGEHLVRGYPLPRGFAYLEDGTLYVLGPQGPVALPWVDIGQWIYDIRLTPSGYVAFGYMTGSHSRRVVSVDYLGSILWEASFPTILATGSYRMGSDVMMNNNYLLVDQEADIVLVYGSLIDGLHALSLATGDLVFRHDLPKANHVTSVARDTGGGYYLTGITYEGGVITRLSADGAILTSLELPVFGWQVIVSSDHPETCWYVAGGRNEAAAYMWRQGIGPTEVISNIRPTERHSGSIISYREAIVARSYEAVYAADLNGVLKLHQDNSVLLGLVGVHDGILIVISSDRVVAIRT